MSADSPQLNFGLAAVVIATVSLGCSTGWAATGEQTTCSGTDDPAELRGCQIVDGDVLVAGDDASLADLDDLTAVTGSLKLRHHPERTDLDALSDLERVDGELQLVTLPALDDLDDLESLEAVGGLHLVDVGVADCQVDRLVDGLVDAPDDVETVNLTGSTDSCEPETESADGDLPVEQLPEPDEMRRGELLEGVHPELVDRLRLMYALLEREGIDIEFVSGYRPHEDFYDRENRHASWHNLGMAVDLNLAHRDGLEEAKRHYEGDDADDWERIGEIASGLGLIWGEWFDDIFHFEWHPDYHARIRDHEYEEFQQLAGDDLDDYQQVWSLFEDGEAEDDADDCSGGCHVIPDDGLRELMEQLR